MVRGIDEGAEGEEGEDKEGDDEVLDCKVSIDGSCLTRGRHAKHGFVRVISNITIKVLD